MESFEPIGLDGVISVVGEQDPPVLDLVDPAIGPTHGGAAVFLTGSGFFGSVDVRFGDNLAVATVLSNSLIIAITPPGIAGSFDVTVTTALGSSTLPAAYSYEPLEVTGISPGLAASCDATPVILEGKGFFEDLEVQFGEALGTIQQVAADGRFAIVIPPEFDLASPTGVPDVDVVVTDPVTSETFTLRAAIHYTTDFIRGDVDGDGEVGPLDVLYLADALSGIGTLPANIDAADTNDNGVVHSGDLIYLNAFVNGTGPAPPAPYPAAGVDPTADGIGNCSE